MTTRQINRRDLLRKGMAGTALGAAALATPSLARAGARAAATDGHSLRQVAKIYRLQAAFHRAKTTQDLELMMSLWADGATFTNLSSGTTYVGSDSIRSFWQLSGSFTHHRFSLVPSYKTVIEVHGDEAFLYFECHDIGDFPSGSFGDAGVRTIASDTFLAGTLRKSYAAWVFWNMTAGSSSPLSFDHYYFPYTRREKERTRVARPHLPRQPRASE
jgi:ketosteroid isomerase-like protein